MPSVTRVESAPDAVDAAVAAVGLRYSTVKQLWPEADYGRDWEREVPVDVVIRALAVERDRYSEANRVLRHRAQQAEDHVVALVDAARGVLEAAPAQLSLGGVA